MRPSLLPLVLILAGCPDGSRGGGAVPAPPTNTGPARVWSGVAVHVYDQFAFDPESNPGPLQPLAGVELAAALKQDRCACGQGPLAREPLTSPRPPTPGATHHHEKETHRVRARCPAGHAFTLRFRIDCWCRSARNLCPECQARVMTADTGGCVECDTPTPSSMIQRCVEHALVRGRCAACDAVLPTVCATCAGQPFTEDLGRCQGCAADTPSGMLELCGTCALRRSACGACEGPLYPN